MMKAWDDVREHARTLLAEGKPLVEVKDTISREYGFEASTGAWQTKLEEWNVEGLGDNIGSLNSSDSTHPRNDSGQWTGLREIDVSKSDLEGDQQSSTTQSLDTHMADTTAAEPHPVRDALLRLYDELRGSLPTHNTENVIKSYMHVDIVPCNRLPGVMKLIADVDLQCYIRLLKIFATSERVQQYAIAELQQIAWLNEDDPGLLMKDCPVGRCKSVEAWCLNHNDEGGYATGIFYVAGDFCIKTLCYEVLDPCPARSVESMTPVTRSASLARLFSRWKNSGRLPEPGEMVSRLLQTSSLPDKTALFEVLCRQFLGLAKDPRALAAIAGVQKPLRYELASILFQDDSALSEWLVLASINLEVPNKPAEPFLESWNPDRRRCFDRSFARFVVPFLGYRRPLLDIQKETAFLIIQCVVHVVTMHGLIRCDDPAGSEAQRRRDTEQAMRMRHKFGLADAELLSNDLPVLLDDRKFITVETAETWLVEW